MECLNAWKSIHLEPFYERVLASIAGIDVPQRWIVNLVVDRSKELGILQTHSGPRTQVIAKQTATIGVTAQMVEP